jgi:hypothetical protein
MKIYSAERLATLVAICFFGMTTLGIAELASNVGATEVPSTEVSVGMHIVDRLTANMTLTFKPKGTLRTPVLSVIGLDIAGRAIGDLAKDLKQARSSALAVIVDEGGRSRGVWFGKLVEPGNRPVQLTIHQFISANDLTNDYILRFLSVGGNSSWIGGASQTISHAQLSEVVLRLPKGWAVADRDPDWKVSSLSDNEFVFSGKLAHGNAIQAQLKRIAPPWQVSLKDYIAGIPTVFLGVLAVLGILAKALANYGWRELYIRLGIGCLLGALVFFGAYDFYDEGPQGWFDRNWWLLTASVALGIAVVLPKKLVNALLEAGKSESLKIRKS